MVTTVCAKCGSRVRPEDAWCSLCFEPVEGAARPVDAQPAAEPEPRPEPQPEPQPEPVFPAEELTLPDAGLAESDDLAVAGSDLPDDWEDGVVATGPRQTAERRALAQAWADRLIAQLAVSESATLRETRLGRVQHAVAERTGLAPAGASVLLGVAGGVTLFLGLVVALTVLGLLL